MNAKCFSLNPFIAIILATVLSSSAYADAKAPVNVDENSKVPLRILTRPGANLYSDNTGSSVKKSNLPTFSSYFVYTRPTGEQLGSGSGWYEVGSDDKGTVQGWIKGDDLFEWKQTMCLTYTHPDGRSPVLMFEDDEYLKTLVEMNKDTRTPSVDNLYASIEKASASKEALAQDFPVISMEPKMAVDNKANFTLMPILDHKVIEFEGREARLLDIVAVSSTESDRKSSDLRTNTDYLNAATDTSANHAKNLEDLKIDVVWCIDTTRSMGPYIQRVKQLTSDISKNISSDNELTSRVMFGAWAYRDSAEIQGLEYVTKNFTPELMKIDDFSKALEEVKETTVDSVTYDEDVFSGLNDAVEKTKWRDNSIRIVILVGDAPGHQAGHKWNVTKFDAATFRQVADQKKVNIYTLHIAPPKAKKYNKIAQGQFRPLSLNPGNISEMYWNINATDLKNFETQSARLTESILSFAKNAVSEFKAISDNSTSQIGGAAEPSASSSGGGEMAALEDGDEDSTQSANAVPAKKPDAPTDEAIKQSVHAALVTWLGANANVEPPRDIEAWVVDKDLKESTRQSLDVNLLMTKTQLDSITTLLQSVLEAGETNQVSGEDFFTSLQAASAVAARDPDKLANAQSIGSSGLVPDFLNNLPYKSRLMEMNNELWESFGPDEQNAFLTSIESKINAYKAIHDDSSLWIPLNEGDDASDYVAAVSLELLP